MIRYPLRALPVVFVFCAANLVSAQSLPNAGQQASCIFYQVNAPHINISKDPRVESTSKGVVESGDIACVSRLQRTAGRDWGYVDYRMQTRSERHPVEGWALLANMSRLTPSAFAMWEKRMAAVAPVAPPAADKREAPKEVTIPRDEVLHWDRPIPFGAYPVIGSTFEKLIQGSPLFPPIDGLPNEFWKEKTCSNCHKWQRESLCIQGGTYVKNPQSVFRHPHPFNGFKVTLMRWAATGCQ
jgi:hypothetical protein